MSEVMLELTLKARDGRKILGEVSETATLKKGSLPTLPWVILWLAMKLASDAFMIAEEEA